MRTTVTIDDDKLESAKEFTGISDNQILIRSAIEYIIAYEKVVARAQETGNCRDVGLIVRELYNEAK